MMTGYNPNNLGQIELVFGLCEQSSSVGLCEENMVILVHAEVGQAAMTIGIL